MCKQNDKMENEYIYIFRETKINMCILVNVCTYFTLIKKLVIYLPAACLFGGATAAAAAVAVAAAVGMF